jgi:hypothetical protein
LSFDNLKVKPLEIKLKIRISFVFLYCLQRFGVWLVA